MIGKRYWSTGVTLRFARGVCGGADGWAASLKFYDDGFAGDDRPSDGRVSTEGELRTRYFVTDQSMSAAAAAAIRAVKADATNLGVKFIVDPVAGSPLIFLHEDNWVSVDTEHGTEDVESALDGAGSAVGWHGARDWCRSLPAGHIANPEAIGNPDMNPVLVLAPGVAGLLRQRNDDSSA
ncbi:Uncharacterised protein [Mycobacteroides abscessus subsp. abscessus]|nr:Uncharacterised protein [Mycobacteroides abscessus subsp. abscessus]SIC77579.1 Uncharacterised protein [Mycobacteroides abscessus subsp. abscessus]SKP27939.1 Uncharacterised protein [Mycobacteroides abscessus subsp. abscessus]